MEKIEIKGTKFTPAVLFDKEAGKFEVGGRSLPEDVASFYDPLLKWLDDYSKSPNEKTIFDFKLTYYNTASSKMLLNIMLKLENLHEDGNDVLIRWHYPEDDEDLAEAGEEYEDLVEVPFEQIAV